MQAFFTAELNFPLEREKCWRINVALTSSSQVQSEEEERRTTWSCFMCNFQGKCVSLCSGKSLSLRIKSDLKNLCILSCSVERWKVWKISRFRSQILVAHSDFTQNKHWQSYRTRRIWIIQQKTQPTRRQPPQSCLSHCGLCHTSSRILTDGHQLSRLILVLVGGSAPLLHID